MTIAKVVPALVVVAAGLLAGCGGYTSDYVAPKDGRARVVWDDDHTVASLPEGWSSPDCTEAVFDVSGNPERYRTYYGGSPSVVIWRPWIVVHHHSVGAPGVGSTGGPTVVRSPANPSGGTVKSGGGGGGIGPIGGGGSSGGSSGGGGGGDIGKAAVVLVVVALLTLPIITLGLGLGRPEPSKEVAESIDQVNAFNDLSRLPNSPCQVTAGAE